MWDVYDEAGTSSTWRNEGVRGHRGTSCMPSFPRPTPSSYLITLHLWFGVPSTFEPVSDEVVSFWAARCEPAQLRTNDVNQNNVAYSGTTAAFKTSRGSGVAEPLLASTP